MCVLSALLHPLRHKLLRIELGTEPLDLLLLPVVQV
jgi:hypothetical protein